MHAPGSNDTGFPPASVSVTCAKPSSGTGPVPIRPFSDWKKTWTPVGRWPATSVGMPIPRLTSMPERSSSAMRLAIMVWASMAGIGDESGIGDEVVDEYRRSHDIVGRNHSNRHDVRRGGDDGGAGHRDDGI